MEAIHVTYHELIIYQRLGSNSFLVPCRFCGGQGLAPLSRSSWVIRRLTNLPCPICNGARVLRIATDDMLVVDAVCHGTGHASEVTSGWGDGGDHPCFNCVGLGLISVTGTIRKL